ncbi:MAG: FtsW/RodA/SpoVE family cell cycle protein, partial [Oscillospiraceae bacterium]
QLVFAVAGVAFMLFISKIDYRILKPLAFPAYGVSLVLLVVVLFMRPLNNARRWIFIGDLTFQPSEIAKFSIVIVFALLICKNFEKMKTFRYGFLPFVVLLLPIVLLMLREPHISGTLLILALAAVMMFIGGTNQFIFIAAAVVGGLGIAAVIINPDLLTLIAHYAGERITVWLDPFSDPLDGGFQTLQSLYAIGSGGLMGLGISGSRQKYLFLPEPHNDFIFAIVCEELGFTGAVFIICIFALLIWRGFVIATRCPDKFGSLVAAGLVSQVGIQTILNIAVVTNTLPNTGISLPFFSYGGTSLLMLLCQMGVVLSISRTTAMEKE